MKNINCELCCVATELHVEEENVLLFYVFIISTQPSPVQDTVMTYNSTYNRMPWEETKHLRYVIIAGKARLT